MKAKAVLFHRKKGPPAARRCLHKRLLCKVTKLEVMVLRMYKKLYCFPLQSGGKICPEDFNCIVLNVSFEGVQPFVPMSYELAFVYECAR